MVDAKDVHRFDVDGRAGGIRRRCCAAGLEFTQDTIDVQRRALSGFSRGCRRIIGQRGGGGAAGGRGEHQRIHQRMASVVRAQSVVELFDRDGRRHVVHQQAD